MRTREYDKPQFPYRWTLKDANFTKDKGTVFSCFACGGGSTMGYKLAGFDVIGCNEIDPRMMETYEKNHHPLFKYQESIVDMAKRDDLPEELYNLDILDGSPPCSSFSLHGNREKDWGKEKKFREGQAKQVLDTLFFDFIDLAKKLQPKIVIAENVPGILMGEAMKYTDRVHRELAAAGYRSSHHVLNGDTMGLPQSRRRVFFVAIRNDIDREAVPPGELFPIPGGGLDLEFNCEKVTFGDIREDPYGPYQRQARLEEVSPWVLPTDRTFELAMARKENKVGMFSHTIAVDDKPILTLTTRQRPSASGSLRPLTNEEVMLASSFPLDYNFSGRNPLYYCGMSVPPIMVANIASRVYDAFLHPRAGGG
jgi:DNA (cytosine-5)-methyltransferase 1